MTSFAVNATSPAQAASTRWAVNWPVAFAAALPLLAFFLSGNVGISLWDEGFLWYGAQRVLAGEVPQLDFQAYDPARYYWSAAWMLLLGSDGVMALRAGQAVLASICVALATWLVRKELRGPAWLIGAVAVSFWIWMAPYEKLADSFAVLLLVAGLAVMLRQRTPGAWGIFGVCLGIATGIGINHGAYGTAAGALAIMYCSVCDRAFVKPALLASLVLGGLAGYLPVLAFHVAVPGYSAAFFDAIRLLFESGTTNITLSLPRPHAVLTGTAPFFMHGVRESVLGLLWFAAGAFLLWGVTQVVYDARKRAVASSRAFSAVTAHTVSPTISPIYAASLFVAVPYTHYFLSRADVVHAAISVLPILLAAWTYPTVRWAGVQRIALVFVMAGSGLLALPWHSGYPLWRGQPLELMDVRGDKLRLPALPAADVHFVQRAIKTHGGDRLFFAAPYWPGAYAIAGQRSPTWEIYLLFPALPRRQSDEIERLAAAGIGFAMLTDHRMDYRLDLGLERTHPLIVRYLERCMKPAAVAQQTHAHPLPPTHPNARVLVAAHPVCPTN